MSSIYKPYEHNKILNKRYKATAFTHPELTVLFREVCKRFDMIFNQQKVNLNGRFLSTRQIAFDEIANIISSMPGGIRRMEKQVFERCRLETGRIKHRMTQEKLYGLKGTTPVYLAEFEPMYREWMDNEDNKRSKSPSTKHPFDMNLFLQQHKFPPDETMDDSNLSIQDGETPGSSSELASQFDISEVGDLHACQSCGKMEKSERMRICVTCAEGKKVVLSEGNMEQLLPFAFCAFCVMEEHVDKEHKTDKLIKYDVRFNAIREFVDKAKQTVMIVDVFSEGSEQAHDSIRSFKQTLTNWVDDSSNLDGDLKKATELLDEINDNVQAQVEKMRELENLRMSLEACLEGRSDSGNVTPAQIDLTSVLLNTLQHTIVKKEKLDSNQ